MLADHQRFARYPSLADRVVLVTGGGSGIGASLVEHFCAQRARVAFVDVNEAASRELCQTLKDHDLPEPWFLPCDLRDIEALRAVVTQVVEKLGPIRALVNNAANDDRHKIAEVTTEYWDERMTVNLRHQFFASQMVHPHMRDAGGGAIVNFGSISWMVGMGGMPAYTTAKAAVHGLTRSLARDFGPDNIRVNTVVPGWVLTQRQLDLWYDEAGERTIDERQCLKSKLLPPDLARMVLFLCADDSAMCTSQEFIVDGGWV